MGVESSSEMHAEIQADLAELMQVLPELKHGRLIHQALRSLLTISQEDVDRLDWKILAGSLQDMERAFQVFAPYRHTRKIAVFGSARTPENDPDYAMAREFSERVIQLGFMVMTGGGHGIMGAANEGAGRDHSFGLNVQLPFEQLANPHIQGDDKLLQFKYFFTRKLFFLRETDAIACFPGGFGTMDELFECLTLIQTGKFGPAPTVLIDRPGGDYWPAWQEYIQKYHCDKGFISGEDSSLYTITDNIDVACQAITEFYQVYHSSRFVGPNFILRLKAELTDAQVEDLNEGFADIVVSDRIRKTTALPEELGDETAALPRLMFHYNQRDTGRLYQLIAQINRLGAPQLSEPHPEQK